MIPLLFKSLAAQLNISKDSSPKPMLVNFIFDDESICKGTSVVVEGFSVAIWSCGTNKGGRISSSGGVCDSWETATGVITFSLFCEDVSSDIIGNKESSVGVFSFKEGTSFNWISPHRRGKRSFSLILYEYDSYGNNTYAHWYQ